MTASLGESTLRWALNRIGKNKEKRRRALESFRSVYGIQKKTGRHDWPDLLAIHVYERKWHIRAESLERRPSGDTKLVMTQSFPPMPPAAAPAKP